MGDEVKVIPSDNDQRLNKPNFKIQITLDTEFIARPPVTTQPTITSQCSVGSWSYMPSCPVPLQRQDNYSKVFGQYSAVKVKSLQESQGCDNISSVSGPSISQDWSRELCGSCSNVKRNGCLGIKALCLECIKVPCMMCDVAKRLGDKSYLPFIPGTGAAIRFKVRILGGIQGSIVDDCLITACCCPCSVCQMQREIEDIGLAPT